MKEKSLFLGYIEFFDLKYFIIFHSGLFSAPLNAYGILKPSPRFFCENRGIPE